MKRPYLSNHYYPNSCNVPHCVMDANKARKIAADKIRGACIPPILTDGENALTGVHRLTANDLIEEINDRYGKNIELIEKIDISDFAGREFSRSEVMSLACFLAKKSGKAYKVAMKYCLEQAWEIAKKCKGDENGDSEIFSNVENGDELYDLAEWYGLI